MIRVPTDRVPTHPGEMLLEEFLIPMGLICPAVSSFIDNPRTGRPGVDLPQGWNEIPGARGCTPQACAFRDHYRELQSLGAQVFGLSTQDSDYQREAAARLHLPFELLSDTALEFTGQLQAHFTPRPGHSHGPIGRTGQKFRPA